MEEKRVARVAVSTSFAKELVFGMSLKGHGCSLSMKY
jgi:hypothetical protein